MNGTKFHNLYSLFIFIAFLPIWNCDLLTTNHTIKAQNGYSKLEPEESENAYKTPIDIAGEWEFHWNKFLTMDTRNEEYILVDFPKTWNGLEYFGTKLPKYGFATYRVVVSSAIPLGEKMGVICGEQFLAYRLFINRKLICANGIVGKTEEKYLPQSTASNGFFTLDDSNLEFLLEISNFGHRVGGANSPILLGTEKVIRSRIEFLRDKDIFSIGCILVISILHFAIYLFRKKDRTSLLFAIFCFFIAGRIVFKNGILFFQWFPTIDYETFRMFTSIFIFMLFPIATQYYESIFPSRFLQKLSFHLYWIVALFCFATILSPYSLSNYYWILFLPVILFVIFIAFFFTIEAVITKKDSSTLFFIGVLVLTICILNDIALAFRWIRSLEITQYGFLVFIFLQAVLVAKKNAKSFENVEFLTDTLQNTNQNLETIIFDRTQKLNDSLIEIKKDLDMAKIVQRTLLPIQFQKFPGCKVFTNYIPFSEVGGDFFDLIPLKNGIHRVFIADATGHGVQAALVTLLIKSEFDYIKQEVFPPSEIMRKLNQNFYEKFSVLESFFSAMILDIDLKNEKIVWASAGHPSPILFSSESAVELECKGHLIGYKRDSVFKQYQSEFHPRERLTVYTDGIIEEFNNDFQEFGIETFKEKLLKNFSMDLKDWSSSVVAHLNEFLGGQPKQDDITLIAIEFL